MSAQVCLRLVEGESQSGGRKDVAERLLRRGGHARAGRGDESRSTCVREVRKRVSDLVLVPARGLPFNENLVAPKRVREFIQDAARVGHATGAQRTHERTAPASREYEEVPAGHAQIDEAVAGISLPRRG